MAELCIVCLGELRASIATETTPETTEPVYADDEAHLGNDSQPDARVSAKSIHSDEETIAHLLPCKHDLHHACLKPWIERANSCPICRAKFNMIELSYAVGGPVVDTYAVQDKVQEAEVDATMVVEDELFAIEAWEPCIVCGATGDTHQTMYCDGCNKAIHVFCAGFDDAPDVWYCQTCLSDLENDAGLPGMASAVRRPARRRPASTQRRGRRNNNDVAWAQVWQEVNQSIHLDLDFPFDEEPGDQRTEEHRREFVRWQRRFEVANRQGANHRLREIASAQLGSSAPVPPPQPESQEELRAWNAFEKARESEDAPSSVRRRKRKPTESPASPRESEPTERPQQKRPRLRRPPITVDTESTAESSNAAARRGGDEPTFLSSLLREMESKPVTSSSPGASELPNGHYSPGGTSPAISPASSSCGSPRPFPLTPPQRPTSPLLSSTIVPLSRPMGNTFSPFSPVDFSPDPKPANQFHPRGRRRRVANDQQENEDSVAKEQAMPKARASSMSPSRGLSYSAKEEIQRMVKLSLGPRYRGREISKDQYTDINRDVSRKLYELVGDASALTDQEEREMWQSVAEEEVNKAIALLSPLTITSD